jgi:hypothetical protein
MTLEEGDIFFCYRPKVDTELVRGVADVQRFFVILRPWGAEVFRRVVIGRKRLPAERERTWAVVDQVARIPEEVEDQLDPVTYQTKTRGTRREQAARPAGEGVYSVVSHEGHTHLAYTLELPESPGPVQAGLNIGTRAGMIVTVRNPDAPATGRPGLPRSRDPGYPPELKARFGDRRFTELDPPDFLDYEGTELVLVGDNLAMDLSPHRKQESAGIFTVLGMEPDLHPLKPLLAGEWE